MIEKIKISGGLRTEAEGVEGKRTQVLFEKSPESWEKKMENFPKYVRRQNLTRFLALYEIFKRIIPIKGSIVECGVNHGFGSMSWAKFSAILEPVNLTRRIVGDQDYLRDAYNMSAAKVVDSILGVMDMQTP